MLSQVMKQREQGLRKGPNRIRILLVEDHTLLRRSLKILLNRIDGFLVVGDTGSAVEAMAHIREWNPDVVLLDIYLPDGDGIDLCREIRAVCPNSHVLMLSAVCNESTLQASVAGGAIGYLHKTAELDQVTKAIRAALSGQAYLDGTAAHLLLQEVLPSLNSAPRQSHRALSLQESRVIALVADGKTNKEIAVLLSLSDKTVKNYISHAFDKLHVTCRAGATAAYLQSRHRASPVPPV